jgi:hypothetical protein
MNYINSSGQVVAIQAIRELHPNMSIPDGAALTSIGYELIFPALSMPEPGPDQIVVQQPPVKVGGVWREAYALADKPVVVPDVCAPAQGLVALYVLHGITEQDIQAVIAAIQDAEQRYTAQIAFSRATEWRAGSPTMQIMAGLLGLTSENLAALFAKAVTVEV